MDLVVWLMLGAFMLFIFYSNKKRKDAAAKLESSVQVGARVIMLGGIVGIVKEITEKTLIVETTPGSKIEFVKAAVRSVEDAAPEKSTSSNKKPPAKKKTTE